MPGISPEVFGEAVVDKRTLSKGGGVVTGLLTPFMIAHSVILAMNFVTVSLAKLKVNHQRSILEMPTSIAAAS